MSDLFDPNGLSATLARIEERLKHLNDKANRDVAIDAQRHHENSVNIAKLRMQSEANGRRLDAAETVLKRIDKPLEEFERIRKQGKWFVVMSVSFLIGLLEFVHYSSDIIATMKTWIGQVK